MTAYLNTLDIHETFIAVWRCVRVIFCHYCVKINLHHVFVFI